MNELTCAVCSKVLTSARGRANHERISHPNWDAPPELRKYRRSQTTYRWKLRQGRAYLFLDHANQTAHKYGLPPLPITERLPDGPCSYCGGEATGWDHVIPLGRGGPHTVENLVPACMPCNQRKGVRSYLERVNRDMAA